MARCWWKRPKSILLETIGKKPCCGRWMQSKDRRAIPASDAKARGPAVTLPALTEAKLGLYSAMRAGKISKAELARRLNCHLPQVDRLLDLAHASRLDQLEGALRAVGKQLVVETRDAA